jgi:hypothetical protein
MIALLAAVLLGAALLWGFPPGALPERAGFMEGPPSIRWILHGSQLLVNGKWVLNPATGRFSTLPYATVQAVPGGGMELLGMSLSAEGDRVVVWSERELRFGPVNTALTGPIAIPILDPQLTEDTTQSEDFAQVLFWASGHQLVLFQFDRARGTKPQCGRFDTVRHQWEPILHCPQGDFLEITQIDPGPDGWISIYSEAEGTAMLLLAQYDPDQGQRDTHVLRFALSPMGFIQAQFSLHGERIDFSTTCFLDKQQESCQEQGEDERGLLFSWRAAEDKLVLVRDDLPPRAIPAPGGDQLAWLMAGRVCISATAELERKACFCLPTASPSTCKPE